MEQQESLEPRLRKSLFEILQGVTTTKLCILTQTLGSLLRVMGRIHCLLLDNG